jgi:hypothetical protein
MTQRSCTKTVATATNPFTNYDASEFIRPEDQRAINARVRVQNESYREIARAARLVVRPPAPSRSRPPPPIRAFRRSLPAPAGEDASHA